MSEVISLINEKGGVGKSSSAITIAQILSISGYSILLIDLDPQMNTSKMFGKSEEGKDIDYEQLFCSKFDDKATVMNYISTTDYENISILCASRELNNLIYKIYDESKESNVELCFKHNLSLLKDDYDYIIIDNSPFKSYLTTCATVSYTHLDVYKRQVSVRLLSLNLGLDILKMIRLSTIRFKAIWLTILT